jgi:hypothetical protein
MPLPDRERVQRLLRQKRMRRVVLDAEIRALETLERELADTVELTVGSHEHEPDRGEFAQ